MIPYKVYDNFFSQEELTSVWQEFDKNVLSKVTTDTGTATHEGQPLKDNWGCWLGHVFPDNSTKIPQSPYTNIIENIEAEEEWFWRYFLKTKASALLSYYGDGDSYGKHFDQTLITCLTWLNIYPEKTFTGGDLILEGGKDIVEYKHNRTVIFPSMMFHEVTPVKLLDPEKEYSGRFCLTLFFMQDET